MRAPSVCSSRSTPRSLPYSSVYITSTTTSIGLRSSGSALSKHGVILAALGRLMYLFLWIASGSHSMATWQTLGESFWQFMLLPYVMYHMKPLRKLETAKGGMDPLPTRVLSQVFPCAHAHLYCTTRQGAFHFPRPHTHKAESPAVSRPACACTQFTSMHSLYRETTPQVLN